MICDNRKILLLCLGLLLSALAVPPAAGQEMIGPPWLRECLIYHHGFDGPRTAPDVNTAQITTEGQPIVEPNGFLGAGARLTNAGATQPFVITGPALSPHQPRTIAFWWMLTEDLPANRGYGLFSLQQGNKGMGYISAFTTGGPWCGLLDSAAVFQTWNLPELGNENNIYDRKIRETLDLRGGVWHHVALVFRMANTAQLYLDGRPVALYAARGRNFKADDQLQYLSISAPIIDELLVLNRAIDGDLLADYVRGCIHIADARRGRL